MMGAVSQDYNILARIMVILIQYTYLSCLKSLSINGATEWTFPGEDRRNKDLFSLISMHESWCRSFLQLSFAYCQWVGLNSN